MNLMPALQNSRRRLSESQPDRSPKTRVGPFCALSEIDGHGPVPPYHGIAGESRNKTAGRRGREHNVVGIAVVLQEIQGIQQVSVDVRKAISIFPYDSPVDQEQVQLRGHHQRQEKKRRTNQHPPTHSLFGNSRQDPIDGNPGQNTQWHVDAEDEFPLEPEWRVGKRNREEHPEKELPVSWDELAPFYCQAGKRQEQWNTETQCIREQDTGFPFSPSNYASPRWGETLTPETCTAQTEARVPRGGAKEPSHLFPAGTL